MMQNITGFENMVVTGYTRLYGISCGYVAI